MRKALYSINLGNFLFPITFSMESNIYVEYKKSDKLGNISNERVENVRQMTSQLVTSLYSANRR